MVHTVLVVEDDPHLRRSLADVIVGSSDLRLAGVAADFPSGLRLIDETLPDVLLVDIALLGGDGICLIRHARALVPHCQIMVFTIVANEAAVIGCIEAGANTYLLEEARDVDIVGQIRLRVGGGNAISPTLAHGLPAHIQNTPTPTGPLNAATPTPVLSVQEHTVLDLSAKGYNYEEIARLMGLSRHTIETYVKRAYRKLRVHTKTEAVYEARKLGLVRD